MWLVRHASTEWNRAGIKFGQLDPPLDAIGIAEAHLIRLPDTVEFLASSPLKRARQTAEIVADNHGLTINIFDGLIEASHGPAEGLHALSRYILYPDMTSIREADGLVKARALSVIETLPPQSVIITHKGVMRSLGIHHNLEHCSIHNWTP